MTKFIFKSNASDLQKISQSLDTIQKNVLYLTYRVDSILKTVNKKEIDKSLQHQVTEYYDNDAEILGVTDPPVDPHDLD